MDGYTLDTLYTYNISTIWGVKTREMHVRWVLVTPRANLQILVLIQNNYRTFTKTKLMATLVLTMITHDYDDGENEGYRELLKQMVIDICASTDIDDVQWICAVKADDVFRDEVVDKLT